MSGDRETGSYWQHLTGKCVHGPLRGKRLPTFSLPRLTAGQALCAYPEAQIALSRLSLGQRIVVRGQEKTLQLLNGRLPPGFRLTMGEIDTRLPLMARGLAVWTDRWQRFYPLETLRAHGNVLIDAQLCVALSPPRPARPFACPPTPARVTGVGIRSYWIPESRFTSPPSTTRKARFYPASALGGQAARCWRRPPAGTALRLPFPAARSMLEQRKPSHRFPSEPNRSAVRTM